MSNVEVEKQSSSTRTNGKQRSMLFLGLPSGDEDLPSTAWLDTLSTHDFDLVVVDPNHIFEGKSRGKVTKDNYGRDLLSSDSSAFQAMARRRAELDAVLTAGGDIVIFAEPAIPVRYYDNDAIISGWNFLPTAVENITAGEGKKVEIVDKGPIGRYLTAQMGQINYRATFTAPSHDGWVPLAVTALTKLCVGAVWTSRKGGRVVILPWMKHDFLPPVGPIGNASVDRLIENHQRVARAFWTTLEQALSQDDFEVEPAPKWAANYATQSEIEAGSSLDARAKELSAAEGEVRLAKDALTTAEEFKPLLYGHSLELERACELAFQLLGASPLPTEDHRADLAFQFDDWTAVVEVKGLTHSARERDSGQLEKWAAEHVEHGHGEPKPILLVNAFRTISPDERHEPAFPDQMLKYATSKGHALVTTSQLFVAVDRIQKGEEDAAAFLSALRGTVGVLPGYELQRLVES